MVKAMAPTKCAICGNSETNLHKSNESILGKELKNVISRLCVTNEAANQVNEKACICTECAIEVFHVDQLLAKVRKAFTKKAKKLKTDKTPDVTANGNTTFATTISSNATTVPAADKFVFNCQTCGFETLKLKAYRQHKLKKHNEQILKPYLCQLCETGFSSYDFYVKHQALKHVKEEMVIKVELPDYNDYDNDVNEEHFKGLEAETNNNENEQNEVFKCLECKYETDKPKVFKRHMLNIHKADKNNIFRCTKCKKSYERVYAYRQHVELMHRTDGSTRTPQFSCTNCERKFFTNMGLNMHLKKHAQAALAATTITTANNEETMLNGATATSTPLNNKKNDLSSNTSLSGTAKNKHLLNVQNLSKNATPLSKKAKNPTLVSKTTQKNSMEISTSENTESVGSGSIKRKYSSVVEPLANGIQHKKKQKKKVTQIEDVASEIEELQNTQDEEEEDNETEDNYICSYCPKVLPSAKRLERHIKKRHP